MQALFYGFPNDSDCWDIEDEYLYGPNVMVAPILYAGQQEWKVYLPTGEVWVEHVSWKKHQGGQTVIVEVSLDTIPVFIRESDASVF